MRENWIADEASVLVCNSFLRAIGLSTSEQSVPDLRPEKSLAKNDTRVSPADVREYYCKIRDLVNVTWQIYQKKKAQSVQASHLYQASDNNQSDSKSIGPTAIVRSSYSQSTIQTSPPIRSFVPIENEKSSLHCMLSFAHTIAAGESFSAAISNDGQVITTSGFDLYKLEYIDVKTRMEGSSQVRYNEKRQVPAPSLVDWHNIVSIAAGDSHLVGLKADGTVIAAGYNQMGQCNVDSYTNIVAVFAGNHSTVALRADGAILGSTEKRAQVSESRKSAEAIVPTDGRHSWL